MSFSMQKLRSLLPLNGHHRGSTNDLNAQRQSVTLEPEVGFQISIEITQQHLHSNAVNESNVAANTRTTTTAQLNVNLIGARHLPALFGFKVVQGYLIKVKLFPGSKRLDSSIQTNSWPKFNEHFKFPLAPDLKPSLKHVRRGSKTVSEFTPEELFAGQFVVFTVYALLELPPTSFNRFNKTYRSIRDKSSNLVQKVVESSNGKSKDDKENADNAAKPNDTPQKVKRKPSDANRRDSMPPLTISESRRNIGSVTCYLEPKIFKRNARTGFYCTEELWLPIKDITTTIPKGPANNLANANKGLVEIALEVRDLSKKTQEEANDDSNSTTSKIQSAPTPTTPTTPTPPVANGVPKNPQWNRMTGEVKRKVRINKSQQQQTEPFALRVTTSRMRCSQKAKDELECTAGSVYVKTTVFEHGIFIDSWKSSNFYPSLSTKWDVGDDAATITIPLQNLECLENILIRTTLATKTKFGKKLVLGTVMVGGAIATGSGAEHMQLLRETPTNERVTMWHSYQ